MARYVKEGYRVSVVTFTDGGKGDILNPAMDKPGVREDLVALRQTELAEALAVLGVTESHLLGWPDSGYVEEFKGDGAALAPDAFFNVPLEDVVQRAAPLLRSTRPEVVVTYDPTGGYPHPDHIRTHDATMAVIAAAADPTALPDAGEAWQVRKVYYHATFTRRARPRAARGGAGQRRGVAVRRVAGALGPARGSRDHHLGRHQRLHGPGPPGTAGAPHADRPRVVLVLGARGAGARASGRTRTTCWPGPTSRPRCRRTRSSPAWSEPAVRPCAARSSTGSRGASAGRW